MRKAACLAESRSAEEAASVCGRCAAQTSSVAAKRPSGGSETPRLKVGSRQRASRICPSQTVKLRLGKSTAARSSPNRRSTPDGRQNAEDSSQGSVCPARRSAPGDLPAPRQLQRRRLGDPPIARICPAAPRECGLPARTGDREKTAGIRPAQCGRRSSRPAPSAGVRRSGAPLRRVERPGGQLLAATAPPTAAQSRDDSARKPGAPWRGPANPGPRRAASGKAQAAARLQQRQGPVGGARAARWPAASPSKQSTGSGARRQSSCS